MCLLGKVELGVTRLLLYFPAGLKEGALCIPLLPGIFGYLATIGGLAGNVLQGLEGGEPWKSAANIASNGIKVWRNCSQAPLSKTYKSLAALAAEETSISRMS